MVSLLAIHIMAIKISQYTQICYPGCALASKRKKLLLLWLISRISLYVSARLIANRLIRALHTTPVPPRPSAFPVPQQ